MKFNGENFWLTGDKFDPGESINQIQQLQIAYQRQSTIYYKSGIPEIDNLFKEKNYIKHGVTTSISFYRNGVAIFFTKYFRDTLEEFTVAHIKRDKILRFEEVKCQNLEVVKEEQRKNMAKGMLQSGFGGLVGGLAGVGAEKLWRPNTHKVAGTIYNLYYLDKTNNEKCIEMYSAKEYEHNSQLFLNTYFKSELSEEAKVPIKDEESSSCFIATACYKDLFAPELITFRTYRDNILKTHIIGILFVKFYYLLSPLIYKQLYKSTNASRLLRIILDRIYHRIK